LPAVNVGDVEVTNVCWDPVLTPGRHPKNSWWRFGTDWGWRYPPPLEHP
jgi:hypothetical protein